MNKLNRFMKIAFSLTLFGPIIMIVSSSLFVPVNYSITGFIVLVCGVVGYLLLPLLPFMRSSVHFWAIVILEISLGKMPDLSPEICISACSTIILILAFIGVMFIKSKPTIYRFFVYLPILSSMVCNEFFYSVNVSWANPLITDIVYLVLAIILDIMVSRNRNYRRARKMISVD